MYPVGFILRIQNPILHFLAQIFGSVDQIIEYELIKLLHFIAAAFSLYSPELLSDFKHVFVLL